MFAYLQRCRLCGHSWAANPFVDAEPKCPHCGVDFAGRERCLVSCDTFEPRVTETWLMRYIGGSIGNVKATSAAVGDFMVETQKRFSLEPQEDLSVVTVPASRDLRVWQRRDDGSKHQKCIDAPSFVEQFMVIQDGHQQLYGFDCMAALLTGWRAAIGDS